VGSEEPSPALESAQLMSQPGDKRLYCNRCKGETNHVSRGSYGRRTHYEEESGYWEELTYTLLTCAGCDRGTLEEAWTSEGMVSRAGPDGEDAVLEYQLEYAPPRRTDNREPKVFRQLPTPLEQIYKESVSAYNSQLYLLCAAGLRALIEGICEDKKVTGKNLEKKIDGLAEKHLPENITKSLHGFRFMGNKAVHELDTPQRHDLLLAIEVAEDLLNFLYELDYKASQLPKKKVVIAAPAPGPAPAPAPGPTPAPAPAPRTPKA
jgi:hypothetical protein